MSSRSFLNLTKLFCMPRQLFDLVFWMCYVSLPGVAVMCSLSLFDKSCQNEAFLVVLTQAYNIKSTCPDLLPAQKCQEKCEESKLGCEIQCGANQSCSVECSKALISCYNSCPCFENCPNGCSNCPSEFCAACDAETDLNYLACANDAQNLYIQPGITSRTVYRVRQYRTDSIRQYRDAFSRVQNKFVINYNL